MTTLIVVYLSWSISNHYVSEKYIGRKQQKFKCYDIRWLVVFWWFIHVSELFFSGSLYTYSFHWNFLSAPLTYSISIVIGLVTSNIIMSPTKTSTYLLNSLPCHPCVNKRITGIPKLSVGQEIENCFCQCWTCYEQYIVIT